MARIVAHRPSRHLRRVLTGALVISVNVLALTACDDEPSCNGEQTCAAYDGGATDAARADATRDVNLPDVHVAGDAGTDAADADANAGDASADAPEGG